jgi:hypothetical protein
MTPYFNRLNYGTVRTFETSVYSNEITRRYIPEGYLHTRRRDILKSQRLSIYLQVYRFEFCGPSTIVRV